MEHLRKEVLHCQKCDLCQTRHHVIWGEGNPHSTIMLIGEAPGADEDAMGRPFVGKSGQLLDRILAACGFSREHHIFITNIVRCRPPQNRVPNEVEVQACIPYLWQQITLIDPKIIIPLGATALKRLLGDESIRISKVRGQWQHWNGRLVMPVYHPAAPLRNPALKKETWEDYQKVVHKFRELVDKDHHSDHV
jgi:DNA polymerase